MAYTLDRLTIRSVGCGSRLCPETKTEASPFVCTSDAMIASKD
jgi:hypothetical protein